MVTGSIGGYRDHHEMVGGVKMASILTTGFVINNKATDCEIDTMAIVEWPRRRVRFFALNAKDKIFSGSIVVPKKSAITICTKFLQGMGYTVTKNE